MKFIPSLVWVPKVDGKFLDSESCGCSCRGPWVGATKAVAGSGRLRDTLATSVILAPDREPPLYVLM